MSVPTRIAAIPILAYCADCKKVYATAPEEKLGEFFACPSDPSHYSRVVKGAAGQTWLGVEASLRWWEKRVGPMGWFGFWGGAFLGRAGRFVAARLIVVLSLALLVEYGTNPTIQLVVQGIAWIVCWFLIADILLSNTSIAFVTRFPAHPVRTVVFTLTAFFTMAAAFGALYLTQRSAFEPPLSFISAIYFSVVTITTVGFGEIHPAAGASLAQILVVLELMCGLYFAVVLFAVVTSWANAKPVDPRRPVVLAELVGGLEERPVA